MTIMQKVIEIVLMLSLILAITGMAFAPMALSALKKQDIYDQWNTVEEFEEVSSLRNFLIGKQWASENVPINDLDYILVLTEQCSSEFFPNVPTSLVLAVISVESSFRKDLVGFKNDTGLMQIIPKYHRERIERYLYDENVTLQDPRVNIMVGMDYLDELLMESNDDIFKAVMSYNMGPLEADHYYALTGHTNYTREVIKRMDAIESFFERREWPCL